MVKEKKIVQAHFYMEKRKTLQLYHIVHMENCPLLPHTAAHTYLGKFSDFKEMINDTGHSIKDVQKCQLCLEQLNDLAS